VAYKKTDKAKTNTPVRMVERKDMTTWEVLSVNTFDLAMVFVTVLRILPVLTDELGKY